VRCEYTEPALLRRLGIAALHEFVARRDGRTTGTSLDDPLDACVRLFLDAESVPDGLLEEWWGTEALAAVRATGLLETASHESSWATALCYPIDGFWLASDVAASMRDGVPERLDIVYPAMTTNTRRFLDSVPETPCERFLELCGGTGAAALRAARGGAAAWTTDITERSTHFATFNAALNAVPGCVACTGDLYAAVPRQTFDRIVAHPPYVATPTTRLIFRDGGADGEAVTQRIIAGLPGALTRGGRSYVTCMATDRSDSPLEQRIRGWLGPAGDEFDVNVFVRTSFTPAEYYERAAADKGMPVAESQEWVRYFERLAVTHLVYASIVLERHRTPRAPCTRRRIRAADVPQIVIERMLDWEGLFAEPVTPSQVSALRPQLRPTVRLAAQLRAECGMWVPEVTLLENASPLRVQVEMPPAAAAVVARMDGTVPISALHADVVSRGELPTGAAPEEVRRFVHQLLSAGMIEFPNDEAGGGSALVHESDRHRDGMGAY